MCGKSRDEIWKNICEFVNTVFPLIYAPGRLFFNHSEKGAFIGGMAYIRGNTVSGCIRIGPAFWVEPSAALWQRGPSNGTPKPYHVY